MWQGAGEGGQGVGVGGRRRRSRLTRRSEEGVHKTHCMRGRLAGLSVEGVAECRFVCRRKTANSLATSQPAREGWVDGCGRKRRCVRTYATGGQ